MVAYMYNEAIVTVNRSITSYVDDAYFENRMNEDKNNESFSNYPIKMMALRVSWLFEKDGKRLLEAYLDSEKLELFECMPNVVIIEFLYKHFKKSIVYRNFPIYLIQLAIYFVPMLT